MEWREFGQGAAVALLVDRVLLGIITGPDDSGYRLTMKATGQIAFYPDLQAAKQAAEREASRTRRDAATMSA